MLSGEEDLGSQTPPWMSCIAGGAGEHNCVSSEGNGSPSYWRYSAIRGSAPAWNLALSLEVDFLLELDEDEGEDVRIFPRNLVSLEAGVA